MYPDDYMVMTAEYVERVEQDADTLLFDYKPPVIIPCYSDGALKFIRDPENGAMVSARKYTTIHAVRLGDRLDGQVVKSVKPTVDFDGEIKSWQSWCW